MRQFLLFLAALLLLTGCSQQSVEPTQATPTQSVGVESTDAPVIINEKTLTDAIRLEILLSAKADQAQYLTQIEKSVTYQVTAFTQTENTITAQVSITAPDMYTIAKAVENEPISSLEELDALLCDKLTAAQTVTKQVEVRFIPDGESWVPVFSEEFTDALYGGLLTYHNEYLAQEVQ